MIISDKLLHYHTSPKHLCPTFFIMFIIICYLLGTIDLVLELIHLIFLLNNSEKLIFFLFLASAKILVFALIRVVAFLSLMYNSIFKSTLKQRNFYFETIFSCVQLISIKKFCFFEVKCRFLYFRLLTDIFPLALTELRLYIIFFFHFVYCFGNRDTQLAVPLSFTVCEMIVNFSI